MDYTAIDKTATVNATAQHLGKWFAYWTGKNKAKAELCGFDGWHFRVPSTGAIVPEELLRDTKEAALRHLRAGGTRSGRSS